MARLRVRFEWLTGVKQPIFRDVRLVLGPPWLRIANCCG